MRLQSASGSRLAAIERGIVATQQRARRRAPAKPKLTRVVTTAERLQRVPRSRCGPVYHAWARTGLALWQTTAVESGEGADGALLLATRGLALVPAAMLATTGPCRSRGSRALPPLFRCLRMRPWPGEERATIPSIHAEQTSDDRAGGRTTSLATTTTTQAAGLGWAEPQLLSGDARTRQYQRVPSALTIRGGPRESERQSEREREREVVVWWWSALDRGARAQWLAFPSLPDCRGANAAHSSPRAVLCKPMSLSTDMPYRAVLPVSRLLLPEHDSCAGLGTGARWRSRSPRAGHASAERRPT